MPRLQTISTLRNSRPMVLPSMLLCDFGNLADEIARLEEAGATGFHMDVMDGRFVPNMTYGMPVVAAVRKATSLPIDVHLMIEQPADYVSAFVDAGADLITFHGEAVTEAASVLSQVRELDVAVGLAINPQTPLSTIENDLPLCDAVLLMSVEAGFGGQSFQPIVLEKIKQLRQQAGDSLLIEVDGGISGQTIGICAKAGADLFVVGSAIFKSANYQAAIESLTSLAKHQEVRQD